MPRADRDPLSVHLHEVPVMSTHTQTARLLAHLKSGRTITPLEALRKYGTLRLGARIWDLKRDGHDIRSRLVDIGQGKRVARYLLVN